MANFFGGKKKGSGFAIKKKKRPRGGRGQGTNIKNCDRGLREVSFVSDRE